MKDTKIISAFPCLGKTFFAKNNKETSIDLESSNYFFDKTGFENLTSEEFKGLRNRIKKEDGFENYLKAIDQAVKSNKYNYVFISQNPDIINIPRRKRIAAGSGRPISEVHKLIKQFEEMRKMMKQFGGLMNDKSKRKGLGRMFGGKLPF